MEISPQTKRELARWYKLDPHQVQLDMINSTKRFNIVSAGRRSGKTERLKRKISKIASKVPGNYFIAAPTYSQVWMIYWQDMKQLCFESLLKTPPSESKLIITLNNDSKIFLIGLDKPKRIEGVPWTGGLVDETAYVKESAIMNSVLPALDTKDPLRPGYKPWCYFIGKPDGTNHFYDLYKYAETSNDPEWSAWSWPSSLVLDKETIDAAKRRMSKSQYEQEYEASFLTTSNTIYPDYNSNNHTNVIQLPNEELHYFCDFNYTPMSHGVAVIRGDNVFITDEIILTPAIARQAAVEFCERYKGHLNKTIYIYGDSSGRNGEKHGFESDYLAMELVFREHGWRTHRCVPKANPRISDRQNAVRAKICTASGHRSFFVNPVTAPWINKACETVSHKKGSAFLEDDSDQYQHITTAFGYFINYRFPIREPIRNINIRGFR